MPFRTNEAAHVEITAFAAGAGPPAKSRATRRKFLSGVEEIVIGRKQTTRGVADRLQSRQITQAHVGKKKFQIPTSHDLKDAARRAMEFDSSAASVSLASDVRNCLHPAT